MPERKSCPECGTLMAVNKDGQFRLHRSRDGGDCPGSRKKPRTRGRTASARDLDERYTVTLCRNCSHPGGQHLARTGCKCGFCGGWSEGGTGYWTDRMTDQLEAGEEPSLAVRRAGP